MKTVSPTSAPALPWPWPRLSRKEFLAFVVGLDAAYRERRAVADLDDRLLKDIGITRADLDRAIARKTLPIR